MNHLMKLWEEPFESIKEGKKDIELRLFDDKRKAIKTGDFITFVNVATQEKLQVKVKKLHFYNSFDDLYSHFDKERLGYNKNEIASPNDMEKYYSKEDIKKYGVVGIEISLL